MHGVIFHILPSPGHLSFVSIFHLVNLISECPFCYFARSSGYCGICVLLLLPSSCGDSWGNDAWAEISFHYNSSHEVINFLKAVFFSFFWEFYLVYAHVKYVFFR